MNYQLSKICTDKITEYLSFPVSEIFEAGDYLTIFGGAVRDSLANKDIHDIDIMCLPKSAYLLSEKLQKMGFIKIDLYDRVELELYKQVHLISEPWTFIKDNTKIIQIIRPATNGHGGSSGPSLGNYVDSFYSLLSDVDISACGVFLEKDKDGIIRLKEAHPHAISHCRSRIFEPLKNNRMYGEERTMLRMFKLEQRGWINLSLKTDLKHERKIKLNGLDDLQKPEYEYKFYNNTKYGRGLSIEESFYKRSAHLT